jgi:hypothetical protein
VNDFLKTALAAIKARQNASPWKSAGTVDYGWR